MAILLLLLIIPLVADAAEPGCLTPILAYAPKEESIEAGSSSGSLVCIARSYSDKACDATLFKLDPDGGTPERIPFNELTTARYPRVLALRALTYKFRNAQESDAGTYRCKVQSGEFSDIQVNVVQAVGARPTTVELQDEYIQEGGDTALVCVVRGENTRHLGDSLTWSKLDSNGVPHALDTTGADYDDKSSFADYMTKWSSHALVIKNARLSDNGKYRCQVEGGVSAEARLYVYG